MCPLSCDLLVLYVCRRIVGISVSLGLNSLKSVMATELFHELLQLILYPNISKLASFNNVEQQLVVCSLRLLITVQ